MDSNGDVRDPAPASASESESESDGDEHAGEYYAPIASSGSDSDPGSPLRGPNGHGVAALSLNSGSDASGDESGDETDSGSASVPAEVIEADRRRRAALPEGAAARIVEAMREIEFPGAPPSWALEVPEEDWLERLRLLRQSTAT